MTRDWTIADIARQARMNPRAVESRMRRIALRPKHRQAGRAGANVWTPATVRAAWRKRGWMELETDVAAAPEDDPPADPPGEP